MDILPIILSTLGGGTLGVLVQKMLMGKKDAADIAQGMVKLLFDQVQTMQAKIEQLESVQHDLRMELAKGVSENAKLRQEIGIMEKQLDKYSKENTKLRNDFNILEQRYQSLLQEYHQINRA